MVQEGTTQRDVHVGDLYQVACIVRIWIMFIYSMMHSNFYTISKTWANWLLTFVSLVYQSHEDEVSRVQQPTSFLL